MTDAADPIPPAVDARLTDLEVRLAFLEHTLSELDGVVRVTADEVLRVRQTLAELRDRIAAQPAADAGGGSDDAPGGLLYEKPPHY